MRVLIADDDAVTRRLLQATLSAWGCEVVVVKDGARALARLEEADAPRFAILDWGMPGMDGLEVCRRLRAAENTEYTYVVLLTMRREPSHVAAGIAAGVDDYLTKPLDPVQLELCLKTGARITRLQKEARARAARDGLTGLPNRATARARLERELARCARQGRPVGVLMADIDHFKNVNDAHGHPVGDEVLREVAQRMERAVRPYDTVGRHGGEEFLIVLPGCDVDDAAAASEHVRAAVAAEPIPTAAGTLRVTMSLGATSNQGDASLDIETLVKAADAALYEAKRAGRNGVVARNPLVTVPPG